MHKSVVPCRSSIHRFATLALYRALLRQCAKLPDNLPERSVAQQYIQLRIHRYKSIQSPSKIAHTLKAGYEALDLLHAVSQGNHEKTKHLQTLLSTTLRERERKSAIQRELTRLKLARARPPSALDLRKQAGREAQRKTMQRHPDAESILARPRPVVNGIRRVPKIVNARGLPMLRIKKPQPAFLSHILRGKHRRRDKSLVQRDLLTQEIHWARDEDEWDSRTKQEPEKVMWVDAFNYALRRNKERIAELDAKDQRLAEAMWKVVLAERELAAKEAKERAAKATAAQGETEQKEVDQLESAQDKPGRAKEKRKKGIKKTLTREHYQRVSRGQ
ncbi:LYR motif-containing protein [Aspergillus homomorphus CBS 101889]|uniref:Complex 1 LYR protein domain-containing protein n=1 Tax=Aspergillus homomorphus (strain CBS 101889) TaxID=1450537 RepID=A0A395IBR4_ASPHC|nr:hypothetical protein BO97DRAFT_380501 [Aspergillus homomorphus CBS 101889]RAL17239.1 hypothetical protein BO97DRAFT_380501 [Aspergillus homomorphus CBS 101889]